MGKPDEPGVRSVKHEVIAIWWLDASASVGWETGTAYPSLECVTVGKIIYEDDKALTIASTWGEFDEDHNCRMTIPKGWVKKRKALKV